MSGTTASGRHKLKASEREYLIFPWVRVKHLASHVLGQLQRRVRGDWHEHFG
ncbi:MAG: DUF4338 domain-containing protein, partial [Deltaproteobacteria bacterium]|nr:DUF4338 domain-containing protein [Deltaproteobacteria bacterium]